MRRAIIALCLVLAATGVLAAQASACGPGWSRSPNDDKHYWTGATAQYTSCPLNGVDSVIYTTNPSIVNASSSGAWDGLWWEATFQNPQVLAQMGFQKANAETHPTAAWAGIAVGGANGMDNWAWADYTDWSLPAIGSSHDYKVTYGGSAFHFFYDNVDRADWSYTSNGVGNSTCFIAEASGEIDTYAAQMPGTLNNNEVWSALSTRVGTTWDVSADQQWHAVDTLDSRWTFPQTQGGTGSLSAFKNNVESNGVILDAYDTCSS